MALNWNKILKSFYPKVNTPERDKFNSISNKYKKDNDVDDCMQPESLNRKINMLDITTSKYMKNRMNILVWIKWIP